MNRATFLRVTVFGLMAGFIAILANTMLLAAADWIPLITAKGGLLKLITPYLLPLLGRIGITDIWSSMHMASADTTTFKTAFHIVVGLVMALFYVYFLESRLPGSAWIKGMIYAAIVWLANAFFVLPLIGEGIEGSRAVTLPGMIYFAVAHTIFFVLLAVLYGYFVEREPTVPLRGLAR